MVTLYTWARKTFILVFFYVVPSQTRMKLTKEYGKARSVTVAYTGICVV